MDDFEKFISELEEYPESFIRGAEKGLYKAAVKIQAAAKRLAPVDAGRLRNSITVETQTDAESVSAAVGTNVKYAPFIEFGTGPVGAASKKDLPPGASVQYTPKRFWVYKDEKKGGFRISKGSPAKPFLYPAFGKIEPDIEKYVAEEIMKEMNKND